MRRTSPGEKVTPDATPHSASSQVAYAVARAVLDDGGTGLRQNPTMARRACDR